MLPFPVPIDLTRKSIKFPLSARFKHSSPRIFASFKTYHKEYHGIKGFVIPTKSLVKIGKTKIFCYKNKMFSSFNKTFGCCSKIFCCRNKKCICCQLFCCRNKTIFFRESVLRKIKTFGEFDLNES